MSKEEKNMKRVISMVLAMVLVLSLAACGSAKGSSPAASDNGNAADTAEKEEKSGTPEAAASEDNKKQQSASGDFDPTMIEAANSNTQAWLDTMAFDDEYIYFTAHYDSYRCRYDGSDVQKLELNLEAPVGADGAVWGYWYKAGFDDAGLFKLDPKTGEMTMAADMTGQGQLVVSILVSGNWLCYSTEGGSMINVRDLTTGEEKTIKINYKESGIRDVPVCIYGNTLYVMDDGILYSYELGSDATGMTSLNDSLGYVGKDGTVIWTEDGLYFVDNNSGYQYYHAKFADLQDDGKWDCKTEENKVGTDMNADDALTGISMVINDNANSKYVLGNDLLVIGWNTIDYYEDFDFTKSKTLINGDFSVGAYEASHGIHEGSVYYFAENTSEILKIAEGGTVEHIPVAIPES